MKERNRGRLAKFGFGLIELIMVLLLILACLWLWPQFFQGSKSPAGYVEEKIATKKQLESQVKDIQKTLNDRYRKL